MMKKNNNEMLVLSSRQSSLFVAALLFLLFFSFLCGYFFGTKHATEEFIAQINQETFADQVLASAHSFSSLKKEASKLEVQAEDQLVESQIEIQSEEHNGVKVAENNDDIESYYAAELIGFGTQRAAQLFIDRVAESSGIILELRTRSSKNNRGKTAMWYQVVTPRYARRHELESTICAITKTEKLHDINIVLC